jgi:hypothetical protein
VGVRGPISRRPDELKAVKNAFWPMQLKKQWINPIFELATEEHKEAY